DTLKLLWYYYMVVALLIVACNFSWSLVIPGQLSPDERKDVVRILAASTSTRFLSSPYPLGGEQGFEFGLTVNAVNTRDLGDLGSGTTAFQPELRYSTVSIGKG